MGKMASNLKHVTLYAKNHEGAGCWQILKGNFPAELMGIHAGTGRSTDLDSLGIIESTIINRLLKY